MNDQLAQWLARELKERSWSIRETARRAGLSHTPIANLLSGRITPGLDVLVKLADALDEPRENVLRMAAILPPLPPPASEEEEALYLFRQIRPEQREAALRMLSGLSDDSQMIPQPQLERISRMGLDTTLQEFIRRIFRLMWEIAPPEERAAMFVEFVGELSREEERQTIEPG